MQTIYQYNKDFDKSEIINKMNDLSEQIKEEGFVEKKYNSFARGMFPYYLRVLKGNSFFQKILYKLLGPYYTRISSKDNLLAVQNFIECDAHRELLLEGLKWKNQ